MPPLRRLLSAAGTPVVKAASAAVELAAIVGEVSWSLLRNGFHLRPVVREVFYRQVYFTGVAAVPFTLFLAFLAALAVAVQAPYTASAGGGVLGTVLVVVLVRELGPIIAATIVIARSGTALTAELATMRVSGEVDLLTGLGVDPFEYLVVPRLLGMTVSLMALNVVFLAVAIGASALLSPLLGGPAPRDLLDLVAAAVRPSDVAALLAKSLVPGLVIAAVGCREGFRATGSETAVPPAITAAVAASFSIVFAWNTMVTLLLYLA